VRPLFVTIIRALVDWLSTTAPKLDGFTFEVIRRAIESYAPKKANLPGLKHAAVAVILRPNRESVAELLFIKRSEHPLDPWSGHMAFPGGRVDDTDPGLFEAVIREVREEIGLDLLSHGTMLARLDDVRAIARGKRMPMIISPFVFEVDSIPDLVLNHEVVEAFWVPLTFFNASALSSLHYPTRWLTIPLPCYRYNDRIIWGLTFRMLQNLLKILTAVKKG
jgi:8-oxo-dGTP pyrophosphatase MutT (NUDIX family)